MVENLQIQATLEAVSQFSTDLEARLDVLPLEIRTEIVLALQELCVNIVKHAYAGAAGSIEIVLDESSDQLRVSVRDHAANAFEMPDEIAPPDPLSLPESGLGLYIIHASFDEVEYTRLADGNQWRLVRTLR